MAANTKVQLDEERRKHPGIEVKSHSEETKSLSEWPPLMKFDKRSGIELGMWYI